MNHPKLTEHQLKSFNGQVQENFSVAFLLEIINSISDPIFVKDRQHCWLLLNDACCDFMGYSREELLGKSDYDLFPKQEADVFWEKDELVFTTGMKNENEEHFTDASGVTHIVSTRKSLFEDCTGNKFLVGTIRDVTKHKRAEEELRASQQRLALLIEQTPLAVIEWNNDFEIQKWNPAAEKMFGYTKDEIIGHHFECIVPQSAKKHVTQVATALMAQQGGISSVNENLTKDGKTIVCEWYNNPLVAPNGEMIGVASMALDVTERYLAQEEQQKFVALIENSSDYIGIASLTGQIQYINPAGLELIGISSLEEAKTKSISDLYSPEDFEEWQQRIDPAIAQYGVWKGEFRYRNFATKKIIPTDCNFFVVKHPETGEPFCRVAVVRDITQRKQAEFALLQSQAQLRQQAVELEQALIELQRTQIHLVQSAKMSSLGQLVAGIAHEINNPINFIFGNLTHTHEYTKNLLILLQLYQQHYSCPVTEIEDFVEEIDLDFLKSDLQQILSSMKVGVERIRSIVLSLRTFSRLDEADLKTVDIHEGIDSTLMILQSRLNAFSPDKQQLGLQHHPGIEVIKEYSQLPLVECYAGQLNQVFLNLLANAIDAFEEGMGCRVRGVGNQPNPIPYTPQIRIRTEMVSSKQVLICIADNAGGIPEEIKERIFDPFFTTKPIGKGTGLGLSISYQIVTERHGGSLQCISEPGHGAEFVISIPVVPQC